MFRFKLTIYLTCAVIHGTSQLDIVLVLKCKENQVLDHLMLLGGHPVILVGKKMWQIFAEKFKFWILIDAFEDEIEL